jgi:hypothetical protein
VKGFYFLLFLSVRRCDFRLSPFILGRVLSVEWTCKNVIYNIPFSFIFGFEKSTLLAAISQLYIPFEKHIPRLNIQRSVDKPI